MEIFHVGNKEADHEYLRDEKINSVVRSFVQIWNEFEDALARELATRNGKGDDPHLNATYEMVYRLGNSLVKASMSMGELSAAISVPLSTASRVVNMLVDKGYVERVHDAADRRIVRVALSHRGQGLYKLMDGYITERVRKITAYLKDDELETLLALLGKAAMAVKEISK